MPWLQVNHSPSMALKGNEPDEVDAKCSVIRAALQLGTSDSHPAELVESCEVKTPLGSEHDLLGSEHDPHHCTSIAKTLGYVAISCWLGAELKGPAPTDPPTTLAYSVT